MNGLFELLGIQAWKPVLTALVLPPVPFLVLLLVGARLMLPRRGLGWLLIVLSVVGLWLAHCIGVGRFLEHTLVRVPPALSLDRIAALKADTANKAQTAIIVLGGGLEQYAPEYGVSNLRWPSLERLRYGLWLSRETGIGVGFTGGAGWATGPSQPEAQAAARVAAQEFRLPLRWTEEHSRDTRENARLTLPMLQSTGIRHVLVVTHGVHMPRALRAFQEAARTTGITIEAAPMGLAARAEAPMFDWLPTSNGHRRVTMALREWLARWMGA